MTKRIPIEQQANVPGGLMSLDPGTIPGQRPPNYGKQTYSRLAYGISPIMQALPDLKAFNALPPDVRSRLSAEHAINLINSRDED